MCHSIYASKDRQTVPQQIASMSGTYHITDLKFGCNDEFIAVTDDMGYLTFLPFAKRST